MKTITIISWRNVWRNKKRSLAMIMAIAVGLWGAVMTLGITNGMMAERQRTTIEQHISHIQIHNPEFLKDDNIRNHIEKPEALFTTLDAAPEVKAYSARTMVSGMLATTTLTTGVQLIGVDAAMEDQTTDIESNIIEGRYLDVEGRNLLLIGQTLADKIKAQVRSRVVLTFQDEHNEIISAAFRVCGIYRTSNTTFDERKVYLRQSDLLAQLGADYMVSEVAVVLDAMEETERLSASLRASFPELEVRSWSEVSPELGYMNEMFGVMMFIILLIILLAVAFGLVNTMLMAVYERIQEMGMLMAVGMNRRKVFGMILLETSFLTLLGAAGGLLLGGITLQLIGESGINLALVGGDSMQYMGFSSVIYPTLEPSFFVTLTLMVAATALCSALIPALRVMKLKPAEAVRAE
ncbi:MAG TPA: ABC transporter permease [Bacteroidales bacterium]|nr:ABC transporter permease [Bacteroidales bacterium]